MGGIFDVNWKRDSLQIGQVANLSQGETVTHNTQHYLHKLIPKGNLAKQLCCPAACVFHFSIMFYACTI